MADIKPFEVTWTEAEVGRVLDQVRAYPWPLQPDVPDGWAYGTDGAWLKGLCDHWTNAYDWRAAVADLNRFPQYTARVEDFDLHFLHVVGEAGGKRPLIVTHGWPGSHYEFWQSIEKLASACYESAIFDLTAIPVKNDKVVRLLIEADKEAKNLGLVPHVVGTDELKKALSMVTETASLAFYPDTSAARAAGSPTIAMSSSPCSPAGSTSRPPHRCSWKRR